LEDEKGAKMIMINRSFNPAGVPFKEGSDTIVLSQFEVKGAEGNASAPVQHTTVPSGGPAGMEDDIPF
jgi:hypothetical protein